MLSKNLLSSQARIQIPWIKVTIGDYTFGAFSANKIEKNKEGFYSSYNVQYPNYIKSLNIVKINGQVNTYTLNITYPVTQTDDPNFFEKVFSRAGNTKNQRKIIFSYGDMSMPSYVYKDEEAIITKVSSRPNIATSVIDYTVTAVSSSTLAKTSCDTFVGGHFKPSDKLFELFKQNRCGIRNLFTGMTPETFYNFVDAGDKAVDIVTKENTSILDYMNFLVSSMVPTTNTLNDTSKEIYILTIHDDTVYDYGLLGSSDSAIDRTELITFNEKTISGPYFKVSKISYAKEQPDAYEIDIGVNSSTIVTSFTINNDESYAIYYDYQQEISNNNYVRRINDKGQWEDEYAPVISSNNEQHKNYTTDTTWWTKVTKYPITATITVQGLLRPAELMSYVRVNIIFPGGHKYIGSGLYLVTSQQDTIDSNGYKTQLGLTRISGDNSFDNLY